MKNKSVLFLTQAALIAALYVVLTFLSNALGLANSAIQIRFSEALTILPFFTPAAIPGLFVGCLTSNILTGCVLVDIIGGSIATLLGAFGTYALRKCPAWLAPFPPMLANILIIPFILHYAYGLDPLWLFFITVGIGEFLSCGALGLPLLFALKSRAGRVFGNR